MRTVVTGGAGFIGSHLVDYLINQGHEVVVIDDLSGGLKENVNHDAIFFEGSITNRQLVEEALKDADVVYHLAAYAAEGLSHFNRGYNYINNTIGSANLITTALKLNIPKFLFTSSMAVYGSGNPPFDESIPKNPEDPYGIAKAQVEFDLRAASAMFPDFKYVIIRPHNIYGERQFMGDPYRNVIGIWMNRILQGLPPLIYGDGMQTRAFSYVGDIIPCIANAPFIKEAEGEIINLGAAKPYTLKEVSEKVINAFGTNIQPKHVQERHEVKHAFCTIDKSERILGFKDKTPLEEGLRKMAAWAKQKGHMNPIIWEGYELERNLPEFWKQLSAEFPQATHRVNASEVYHRAFREHKNR
jgi:UDP-glucose 4-epimerase